MYQRALKGPGPPLMIELTVCAGKRQVAFAGTVQYVLLVMVSIGYTVTAAMSMV